MVAVPISVGAPLQVLGHTSADRVVHCTVLVGCASSLEILLASGGLPQALTLFGGVRFIPYLPYLPTPPLGQDMTQAEFNRFEFRVFLLLD